jgi:hypothetical protein
MPALDSNGPLSNNGDSASDILAEVSLVSFNANPTAIGPFGASVLSWNVTGPTIGFHAELNGQNVARSDQQVVQPTSTTTYRLTANAKALSKILGTCQVAVDDSGCQIAPILNDPKTIVSAPLIGGVTSSSDLFFRGNQNPDVTFSPGRIRAQLHLGKHMSHFDADVDIDTSFGLTVTDGALAATNELISVDISLPLWVQVVYGAVSAPQIALAKIDVTQKMQNAIQAIVGLLNAYTPVAPGFRRRSVRVDDGNNGAGIVETTECPVGLLLQFANISHAKATE